MSKLPILILTFNRVNHFQKLFSKIRSYQPRKIYISSDGPRNNSDLKNILKIRSILDQKIDWDCRIIRLYENSNLGLKKKVNKSLNFFFQKESMGIILEDDCIPNKSFFKFCEIILNKYKNEKKISMLTGTNLHKQNFIPKKITYYFSQYYNIWGWATWADRWNETKFQLKHFKTSSTKVSKIKKLKNYNRWLYRTFKNHQNKNTSWAIEWFYNCLQKETYVIVPEVNLITNIGESGTHSLPFEKRNLFLKNYEFSSIVHRKYIEYDFNYDYLTFKKNINFNIFIRIFLRVIKIFIRK